jgi:hypothetical protein
MNRRSVIQWILALAGLGFLVASLVAYRDQIATGFVLSPWRFVMSAAITSVSLGSIGISWGYIHDPSNLWLHVRRFLIIQPAKYVPGGIAQPVGQIVAASQEGSSLKVTSSRFVAHAGVLVCAGMLVGTALVADPDRRGLGLLSAAISLGLGVALVRLLDGPTFGRLVAKVFSKVSRGSTNIDPSDFHIPRNRLLLSLGFAVVGLGGISIGFAIIAQPSVTATTVGLIGAFAISWTVGFIAVPFPAGLGVREIVLAAVLPGALGPLVAASLMQRVAQLVAEGLAAGLSYAVTGYASIRRSTETAPRPSSDVVPPAGPTTD